MKTPCPSCNQRLDIPAELAGQTIQCPVCNGSVPVPPIASAPPPPLLNEGPSTPPPPLAQSPTPSRRKKAHAAGSSNKLFLIPWPFVLLIIVVVSVLPFVGEISSLISGHSNYKERVAIYVAIEKGDLEGVREALEEGADVNSSIGGITEYEGSNKYSFEEGDKTPLHWAVNEESNYQIVELLIEKGANVNAVHSEFELTPLHEAVMFGHYDVAELLINNGADVNAEDKEGETPFDSATLGRNDEISQLLRNHGGKHGLIHGAVAGGDFNAVKQFIEEGIEVDLRFESREFRPTPLHTAVKFNQSDIAKLLIAEGADVNAKTENEVTPLMLATFGGSMELVELLIAEGADVNAESSGQKTALDLAETENESDTPEQKEAKIKIAEILRTHGGKSKSKDGNVLDLDGKPAGELVIAQWVKGEEVDLSEGVNVVEFWATWCPPCRTSIPHLTKLQDRFKDRGVKIIGISREPLKTVAPFVRGMGSEMDYTVAVDDWDATSRKYMGRYGVKGIPHAFVVKDGAVVWHGHPMSGLDEAIEEALD